MTLGGVIVVDGAVGTFFSMVVVGGGTVPGVLVGGTICANALVAKSVVKTKTGVINFMTALQCELLLSLSGHATRAALDL